MQSYDSGLGMHMHKNNHLINAKGLKKWPLKNERNITYTLMYMQENAPFPLLFEPPLSSLDFMILKYNYL